jgi:hypothetical protein
MLRDYRVRNEEIQMGGGGLRGVRGVRTGVGKG